MWEDDNLDPDVIFRVLVYGEEHGSLAFENFRRNPEEYMAPLPEHNNNSSSQQQEQDQTSNYQQPAPSYITKN